MSFSTFNCIANRYNNSKVVIKTYTQVVPNATLLPFTASGNYTVSGQTGVNSYLNGIYTTSASTEYSTTTYGVWQCFGNNVSNSWASKPNYSYPTNTIGLPYSGTTSTTIVNVGSILGEWCQIAFPYSFILTKWNVTTTTGGASGRVVYLVGSTDGTTWNQLDYYSTDGSSDTHLATLSNSTSYIL